MSSDDFPDCPDCAAAAPHERPRSATDEDDAKIVHEHELDERWRDRVMDQGVRHSMSTEDVLAQYELPKEIACSILGQHRHKAGLVVRSKCGRVLFLGSTCGRQHVVGFSDAEKLLEERRFKRGARAALSGATEHALAMRQQIDRCRHFFDLKRRLADDFEALVKDANERARLGAPGREVAVRNDRGEPDVGHLRGLEFWSGSFSIGSLEKARSELAALGHHDFSTEGKAKLRKASKRLSELLDESRSAERWVESAAAYFNPTNLDWSLQAIGMRGKERTKAAARILRWYRRAELDAANTHAEK